MAFKPRSFSEAKANHKPMKRSRMNGARRRMNQKGRKTNEWDNARAWLKIQFNRVGIRTCELRYAGCAFDNYLGFAHSKKRRNITGDEMYEVALLCNFCHEVAERLPEAEMTILIKQIIAARHVTMC